MIPASTTGDGDRSHRGIIEWFIVNPIAANFLMVVILLGGLFTAGTIRKQLLPQEPINTANISISYPGAAAKEVEQSIALKVEAALENLQGIQNMVTYSDQGSFSAILRIDAAYDPQLVLNRIQSSIDALSSLPGDAEKPVIELEQQDQDVLHLVLYGDLSERQLKSLGNRIFHDLQALSSVRLVELLGNPTSEISIEINRDKLREYGLTFDSVADAIRQFSSNLPAGQIESTDGIVSVRVANQAQTASAFALTPIVSLPDGTRVLLGDIANVKDTFVDGVSYSTFNGQSAVSLFVRASDQQSISEVAAQVKQYVTQTSSSLPDEVVLEPWIDFTFYLEDRLQLMLTNIKWSLALVFLVLFLFLEFRLALWITLGLPVSVLGALALMPIGLIDVTINIASLFGFVLVLGIVVDDAIVIGESVHSKTRALGHSARNVLDGVKDVALPVTAGVLTTMIAFVPLLMSTGEEAAQSKAIAWVVILCLTFSLIESKLILPAHLYQFCDATRESRRSWMSAFRSYFGRIIERLTNSVFDPFLRTLLDWRYVALCAFLSLGLLSITLFSTGWIAYIGSPKIAHDFPSIEIEFSQGIPSDKAAHILRAIEAAILQADAQIKNEHGKGMIESIYVNSQSRSSAEMTLKLVSPDERPIDPFDLTRLLHESIPEMPGLESFVIMDALFSADIDIGGGGDLVIALEGKDEVELENAANELTRLLRTINGLTNLNDSLHDNEKELKVTLNDVAYNLGLSHAKVAEQINSGFYGLEAQRLLRNGEEIRVMIRYPLEERQSLAQIRGTVIALDDANEVLLSQVADVEFVSGSRSIRRENGKSSVAVSVNLDPSSESNPDEMLEMIVDELVPQVLTAYPSVSVESGGRFVEEGENIGKVLKFAVLCFLLIYALIAVLLKSYAQPLIVMMAIPFCFIGAVLGHVLMAMDLSSYSLFGLIAAAGVCVNDSLVLVDYINRARRLQGVSTRDAVAESVRKRFRAVALTSVTTFVGLSPILLETGLQAKIVVPMAVSLAFGVMFATCITLLLVPCLYYVFDDLNWHERTDDVSGGQEEKGPLIGER